jgi:UDP-glucose 4-epimerase
MIIIILAMLDKMCDCAHYPGPAKVPQILGFIDAVQQRSDNSRFISTAHCPAMIFVTGGAGYIGTHTCVELLNAGHEVTVFDNFSNSQPEVLARVQRISGKKPTLVQGDIRDSAALEAALRTSGASAVIHFAGLKAVGESVHNPLAYYDNNVVGTVRLLQAMQECGVKTLVFSSSATVYGDPGWRFSILRYFNPVGAHASGLIGEDPQGTPNNLLPFVAQVAVGRREFLNV